jgi:hypothetical protein
MKNKSELTRRFIELRAMGTSFDEIVMEIKVSKPTLIKWAKQYKDHISLTEKEFAKRTAAEIVMRKKNLITSMATYLLRAKKYRQDDPEEFSRASVRASKKIFALFNRDLQSIELKLWDNGEIRSLKINMVERE